MSREPEIGGVVHLKHPSGSSAKIARYVKKRAISVLKKATLFILSHSRLGATVLSLQTPRAGEILWLDPDWPQPTRGSNNRRGGIPVMFPNFGNVQDERIVGKGDQRDMRRWMKDTPHHGFAKDCVWDLVTTDDGDNNCDWPIIENETSHDYLSCVVLRLCPAYVPADLGASWLRGEILYR
jgi:D-hexose-6-phosphate mutarotase